MQGVLISTNDQEKICVSEAYNLLNEVRMHGLSTHDICSLHGIIMFLEICQFVLF